MYCGTNYYQISEVRRHGTRNGCLRKGISAGMRGSPIPMPDQYQNIYGDRVYCGDSNVLPADKTKFGTPTDCLHVGFGVGRMTKWQKFNRRLWLYIPAWIVWVMGLTTLIILGLQYLLLEDLEDDPSHELFTWREYVIWSLLATGIAYSLHQLFFILW